MARADRAPSKIVESRLDVKTWLARVPAVDTVRPATCPCRGRAGVPTETLPRRLYTVSAVAWALALFGVEQSKPAQVWRRTSPLGRHRRHRRGRMGDVAPVGARVRDLRLLPKVRPSPADFTDRQVAERAAMTAAALATPSLATPSLATLEISARARPPC